MNEEQISYQLETNNLSKFFGGLRAVDDVTLNISRGGIHSIIGPNGAGKTTLLNLLSGVFKPTSGLIFYNQRNITDLPAFQRAHIGIGRSFQITNIFPTLSVFENVRLAAQALGNHYFNILSDHKSYASYLEQAAEALKKVGLSDQANAPALSLNHGDKRRLEVGMLLAQRLELFLLDEPTAGLGTDQVPEIMEIISEIALDRRKTIILVEHNMNVVMNLSERIYVMHHGKMLAEGTPEEISKNQDVQQAYLGGLYDDFVHSGDV